MLWFFMLESGAHATIAGVVAALSIPSKPKKSTQSFVENTKALLIKFKKNSSKKIFLNENQKAVLHKIKENISNIDTPASKLEYALHLPVSLIVIPLFALANAGIEIDFTKIQELLFTPVSLGIINGLVIGKVVGIFGVSFIMIKLGLAKLPKDSTFSQLFGVAFLGGIGFTMSIFVGDLAFKGNVELILQAKAAILVASIVAGTFGYLWLRFIATSTK